MVDSRSDGKDIRSDGRDAQTRLTDLIKELLNCSSVNYSPDQQSLLRWTKYEKYENNFPGASGSVIVGGGVGTT